MIDPTLPLERIVSGGQTGADRAGLDWALDHGIPHGGWCPQGRRAEDGPISTRYELTETAESKYHVRTRLNVEDSDGTAIFGLAAELTGGSALTREFAQQFLKPWIHISQAATKDAAMALRRFLIENSVHTLNIAGPRASSEFGIADFTLKVLDDALLIAG
ncbi:MAG: putative molybdenum carrier protein [Verrucomicrobiota bacterium]